MKSLLRLNKYFAKYKWRLLLGILMVTASNLFKVYQPSVVRQSFDEVQEAITNQQDIDAGLLLYFAALLIALAVVHGIFLFFSRQTIIVMSRFIEFDLKNEVFRHYQKLSAVFYKRNNTGDLINRVGEDVSKVRMYIGPAIMYTTNFAVMTLFTVISMFMVNTKLTLFVLIPLPILSITIYKISKLINIKSEKVQQELSNLSTATQEAFSGIRVLKAYAKEKEATMSFQKDAETYRKSAMSLVRTNAMFHPFMILLIGLSTIITIFIGGMLAINGDEVTIGNIAEFVIYVNMLTWPVASLGWVTSLVQQAAASQKRLNEFLDTEPEITSGVTPIKAIDSNIRFNNVGFTYPDSGTVAAKDISFEIKKGTTVGIIGRTGSGKSTIAQLLNRTYDVQTGSITINDLDIRELNLQDLRQEISYVPQEVFLFSDTIANNIAFGVPNASESQIVEAAKQAELHDSIVGFPDGYQTKLGERGINLSGGQKQRLSIARALIKNSSCFVLDDALSAVDTQTEDNILGQLGDHFRSKTVVIISHRISAVRAADHIIVMNEGEIIEQGQHQDLLDKRGEYFDLHSQQGKSGAKNIGDKTELID